MVIGVHFLKRVLESDLIIPSFHRFCISFKEAYQHVKEDPEYQSGKVANYIPALAVVNPQLFATSFCSLDGQFVQYGDFDQKFSIQSIGKVVSYAYLYELMGEDVHKYVGEEPSGLKFNAPAFDEQGRPHNPMINSGAIMVCALLLHNGKNLNDIINFYYEGSNYLPVLDEVCYKGEKITGHTNHALTSLMLANDAFPIKQTLEEQKQFADDALDLYFKLCSLLVNVRSLANFGAMCANNGINPFTGKRVLSPETIRNCVTFMTTCGMYNGAGKFTKKVGVPSKSGVSGGLLTIVPGLGAFASWSPPLNNEGNSVRAIGMIQKLSQIYSNFNIFHKDIEKRDVTKKSYQTIIQTTIAACSCASMGDLEGLNRLNNLGVNLDKGDFDSRTPLHLAASLGHLDIVQYLVEIGIDINAQDRWGATALNDASKKEIIEYLKSVGGRYGKEQQEYQIIQGDPFNDDKYRLLYAASDNDLLLIKSLLIQGMKIDCFDYDGRTALHLAASEGHEQVVKYLVTHGASCSFKDARGNTPLNDAMREQKKEVQFILLEATGEKFSRIRKKNFTVNLVHQNK